MSQFGGNLSKLIFSGSRNTLFRSSQSQIPINFPEKLRFLSSTGNGDSGETTSQNETQNFGENPRPNRPLRGRGPVSSEDDSFLDRFKLGADGERPENPPRREAAAWPKPRPPPPPPEDADEIFKRMKETGLIPNAVAMLDGLCKDGLVQEAMKLFGLMREKGTIPEVVIYTAVVDGFCKAQKLDDAVRIFRKMQSNGIDPNAFSYSVLIQGLCGCKRLDDGVEFCVEMLEAGHSPNVATFVRLVDGLCQEKGVEEAQGVIGKLREKGFLMNEKAVREFLDKKAAFSPSVWEAIFGKKASSQRLF
ncbi:hypothetical protein TIFTF001_019310 [Ficus carica]|uniref:Pentatricopeptide repeat-containing protein n=1 Tax=Ficus carica TaxID=3494 RepID=A0AA88ACS9_FICCA|nr:hypothetical protein TIFTF001_019310 [Ficus carica]